MKILYLYRNCNIGGVNALLANRLKYLKNVAEPYFGYLRDFGGRSIFGDYPRIKIFFSLKGISSYIARHQFEVIIIIDTNEVYPAINQSGYRGVLINEVHTTYPQYLRQLPELANCRTIAGIITPSLYLKERVLTEYNLATCHQVYQVENLLDTELFQYRDVTLKSNKRIILWVGKLDPLKNWPKFLEIAARLNQQRADCEFWLVGGYTAPATTVAEMRDLVTALGLTNSFKWLPRVEYNDMPKLYSAVSKSKGVYLSTTCNESFGMTIVEALACKCPVVAPEVGAIPEILSKELQLGLYQPHNVNQAVTKIENFLDNDQIRHSFTKTGEELVKRKYGIYLAGRKYFDLIKQIKYQSGSVKKFTSHN